MLENYLKIENWKLKIHRRKIVHLFGSLIAFGLISVVFIKLTAPSVQAAWYDDTYSYRLRFTFTHNADITTERSVTFSLDTAELITANLMQSDCDDTRFTDGNGKVLPYDLTGTCNNAATTYEVIFPSILNGTNVAYVYYGNASATNAEIVSTGYTALTPSGGDPSSTAPTTTDEQGPGPVAYWGFNEGSSATTGDITGHGHTGTLTGSPTILSEDQCVLGKCLRFGSGNTAYVTNGDTINDISALTAETWIKMPSLPANGTRNTVLTLYNGTTTAFDFAVASDAGTEGRLQLARYTSWAVTGSAWDCTGSSSCNLSTNSWTHVAVTHDGSSTVKFYVNGSLVGTFSSASTVWGAGTFPTSGNTLRIKFSPTGSGNATDLDETRFYNYVRTASQIKGDFVSRGSSKDVSASFSPDTAKSLSQGLIGYWKLDEATNTTRTDSSGNGNTLTETTGDDIDGVGAKFGNGGDFENSSTENEYLAIADGSQTGLDLSTALTLTAWIKIESFNSGCTTCDVAIISKDDVFSQRSYSFTVTGSGSNLDDISLALSSDGTNMTWTEADPNDVGGIVSTGSWYHVVATWDGSLVKIYINGALKNTKSFSGTLFNSSDEFDLGGSINNEFDGIIDEARVYTRALSGAEVEGLYNWAPGPVGWWKMDENTSTNAYDATGNNQTGTLTTSPLWKTGKYGSSVEFNGSNNYVAINDTTALRLYNQPLTISAWIYPKSYGLGGVGNIVLKNVSDYAFYVRSTNSNLGIYLNGGASRTSNANVITLNQWQHVAVTHELGGTITFYVNGIQAGTSSEVLDPPNNSYSPVIGYGFDGSIDDFKIYNYARSSKQIFEDMNGGHPAGGSPIGSQSVYWNFDEGQGTTANNKGTASSSNGTLTSIASPATATSGWTFTGKVNKGLIFDGSNDNVVIATANDAAVDFATSEQFSASAWVYVTTMPGASDEDAIIAKWDASSGVEKRGYRLYLTDSDTDSLANVNAQIYDESANQAITASSTTEPIAVNAWYHVSFTFNGGVAGTAGDLKIYINGAFSAQNSANTSFLGLEDVATDFTVAEYDASDAVAANTAFTGTIDEVKVYSGLLSQAEILVDMNAGSSAAMGGVLGTQDNEGFGGNPPVGWWKMDEASGNLVDSSGNDNTGTITGTTVSTGKIGKSRIFNGTTDLANAASPTILDDITQITISAWINPTSFGEGNFGRILSKGNTSVNIRSFYIDGSNGNILALNEEWNSSQVCWRSPASSISTGSWQHVAVTYDLSSASNDAQLYINGAAVTTTNNGCAGTHTGSRTSDGTSDFVIGNLSNASRTFDGRLDDIKVYNYIRTPAQIAYDYNRGAPVAWYKFDECSGTTAYNAALNANGQTAGNNGTITPGASGNTTTGSCGSGTATEMWNDGTTGKYNSALGFDGTDDYVTVSDNDILDITQTITLSAWVKRDVDTNDFEHIINKNNQSTWASKYANYRLTIEDNDQARFGISDAVNSLGGPEGSNEIDSTTTIPADSSWHHLAGSYDGTNLNIYIDGKLNRSKAYTLNTAIATSAFPLVIGTNIAGGTELFNGQIDDVRIYNYSLTTSQVRRLYNENSAVRFGPQTGSP